MARLEIRVTPRSSRDRIEWVDGRAKVWTTSAPTDGQANEAVRKLLAKRFGLAPSKVTLVRGETAREKTFEIEGLTLDEILGKLSS